MGLSKTLKSNPSNNVKEKIFSDRNYVFTFGKHKGYSIDDVMYVAPEYLLWLHDNSDFFCLSQELLDEVNELIERWKDYASKKISSTVSRRKRY